MGKLPTSEAAKTVAEAVEAADHGLDPTDSAVTGIPRDERHDSIDSATGLLTPEAQELRAERGISASGETFVEVDKPAE